MKYVIDASVALTWLLRNPADSASDVQAASAFEVLEQLRLPGAEAHLPALGFLEIANIVARAESRGIVDRERVQQYFDLLRVLPLRVDHQAAALAFGPILQLARLHGLTTYDAAYLELSIRRALPLATLDEKLARCALESRR